MLYSIKEAWTSTQEDGMYGNVYESIEVLESFEGKETNVAQGYIIIDERTGLCPEWSSDYYDDYFDALEDLTFKEGGVYVGPDCIAIYGVEKELVYWHQDEWLEDPTVAVSIANAIRIYYEEGAQTLLEVIGRG